MSNDKGNMCEGCGKSADDVVLFSIGPLPPEIPFGVFLCKPCLNIAMDKTAKKNRAK